MAFGFGFRVQLSGLAARRSFPVVFEDGGKEFGVGLAAEGVRHVDQRLVVRGVMTGGGGCVRKRVRIVNES